MRWPGVEVLEGQADLAGAGGLEVEVGESGESVDLRLGEIGFVVQPDVAGLVQFRPVLLLGAANQIDGIIDDLDRVELVEW
jgi:hypothetical protein